MAKIFSYESIPQQIIEILEVTEMIWDITEQTIGDIIPKILHCFEAKLFDARILLNMLDRMITFRFKNIKPFSLLLFRINEIFPINVEKITLKNENFQTLLTIHGIIKSRKPVPYAPDEVFYSLQPEGTLENFITWDNLEGLLQLSSSQEFEFDSIIQDQFSMLTFAAYSGSLNCFKFILNNNIEITKDTLNAAFWGNNYEIIHICENSLPVNRDCIETAVQCHHNETVRYLIDKYDFDYDWMNATKSFNLKMFLDKLMEIETIDERDSKNITAFFAAAFMGIKPIMDFLLACGADINFQNPRGETALNIISQMGDYDTAVFLLEHHADVNLAANNNMTPLISAVESSSNDIVKLILEFHPDVDAEADAKWTALMKAACTGNIELTQILIEHKAKIDIVNALGWTALTVACMNGSFEVAKILLENNANFNILINGDNLLMTCAFFDKGEIAEMLIKKGIDVDSKNPNSMTALQIAASKNAAKVIEVLLKYKADIEYIDGEQNNALIYAVKNGAYDAVTCLLNHGANMEVLDSSFMTPLMIAAGFDFYNIVKLLIEKGALVDKTLQNRISALHYACGNGSFHSVKFLLENGADVNLQMINGATPLMLACANGEINTVLILLEYNPLLDVVNERGFTALIHAFESSSFEIFCELVKHGANVNVRFPDGWPLLSDCARLDRDDYVKILLDAKADIEIVFDESTPLYVAALYNCERVAKLLIERGANVNSLNIRGWTPLMIAADKNSLEVAKLLVKAKCNLEVEDIYRYNALFIACNAGSRQVFNLLVFSGAYLDKDCEYDYTCLMLASGKNKMKFVKSLVSHGANMDKTNKLGVNALMIACMHGNTDIAKFLISSGCKIDARTVDGNTALHYAVTQNCCEVTKLLLEKGADPFEKNGEDADAYSIAESNGFDKINELLRQYRISACYI